VEGFAVYAAGGMGAKSRVASLLHEFIPAAEAFLTAEAVKRVFDQHGDRKNKHRARLRFLVERIGFEAFRKLYNQELSALRKTTPAPLQTRPWPSRGPVPAKNGVGQAGDATSAYARWRRHQVTPQKQSGYYMVSIPLQLGDVPAGTMKALAEIVAGHGDGVLNTTQAQNFLLRWITEGELPDLHAELGPLGLAEPQPSILQNLVACAGASTCRLGICLSRGLAKAITQTLRTGHLDMNQLGNLKIHVSGCPNACGRHPVAEIGFAGAARRVGGQLAPHYAVHLGGRVLEGLTRLGLSCGTIPARNVPAFLHDFLDAFLQSPQAPDFHQFVDQTGHNLAQDLVARHRQIPALADREDYYFDWDAAAPFSLAGRGPGECSAGVFDLIELDLAGAREALAEGQYYAAAVLAARSLLVTCGVQPKNDQEAFALFQRHFLAEGLVESRFESLIAAGVRSAASPAPDQAFAGTAQEVADLVKTVRLLYENMDASLRFKPVSAEKEAAPAQDKAHAEEDFRGVACPLNYVKTKKAPGPTLPS